MDKEQFERESKELINISDNINDGWMLEEKKTAYGNSSYLVKKVKEYVNVNGETELISFEYHCYLSTSFQVPALCFNAFRGDGTLLSIDESLEIFQTCDPLMRAGLTQMEHPILFRPFFTIHPCRTAELLADMPQTKNQLITFLSIFGPFIRLSIDNNYGKKLKMV